MKKKIIEVSTAVRKALENSKKTDHHSCSSFSHADFPRSCCGDTSEVLQVVLYKLLGIITHHVSSTHYSGNEVSSLSNDASHAWLEFDNLIIDITADQFNDRGFTNEPITVTENTSFHDLFNQPNFSRPFDPNKVPHRNLLQTINFVLRDVKI